MPQHIDNQKNGLETQAKPSVADDVRERPDTLYFGTL